MSLPTNIHSSNLDWEHLGFAYTPCEVSFAADYKDGCWQDGILTSDHTITLSECAGIFHYCQEVFEGLKAYTTKTGDVVCFRPRENAIRMKHSAERLCMPAYPVEAFVDAVRRVVEANAAWIPPYGTGATLYIRPFMIASSNVIGVKPAQEYHFRILVTPVGAYYQGGVKPVKVCVPEYDRAAPHGTGNIKAGLNYAMSMYPSQLAHERGYADNMYLDPQSHTYVEEAGGANFLFVDHNNTLVVPKSNTDSILPSITRRSLIDIATDLCGMHVCERKVAFEEVAAGAFKECGMCGTAAVISPVGEVHADDKVYVIGKGMTEVGATLARLRKMLIDIQTADISDPFGWVEPILTHEA